MKNAIARSVGQRIPNEHLASFGPGDVVVATDGLFWITPEWGGVPLPTDLKKKVEAIVARW